MILRLPFTLVVIITHLIIHLLSSYFRLNFMLRVILLDGCLVSKVSRNNIHRSLLLFCRVELRLIKNLCPYIDILGLSMLSYQALVIRVLFADQYNQTAALVTATRSLLVHYQLSLHILIPITHWLTRTVGFSFPSSHINYYPM